MGDIQTKIQETPELVAKREAWGQMGVAVHQTELQLQIEAQQALTVLADIPSTIEEIPQAEINLTSAKQEQKKIETKRKEITTNFDQVTARLMQPEKSFAEPVKIYTDAIIKVKKDNELRLAKQKNIDDEKTRCREFFLNKKIEVEAALANKLLEGVSKCYEAALNTNVEPKYLEVFKQKSCALITDKMFLAPVPTFSFVYITNEDVTAISKEVWVIDSSVYPAKFAIELEIKFSDYDVAFANKAQALANSQKEAQEAKEAITTSAAQQAMAVKIEAATQVPTVQTVTTKALKQSYIVDMPETVESVLNIFAAFSANLNLCLPFLKVTKWFAFTSAQAATALGKVKCEDNLFAPSGITFKQIDKL